jgi:hypothetical protein
MPPLSITWSQRDNQVQGSFAFIKKINNFILR